MLQWDTVTEQNTRHGKYMSELVKLPVFRVFVENQNGRKIGTF